MRKNYDLVVVGGGPSGITLAKRLGKKMTMAIVRPEENSMIYCAMPYVIENLIEEQKCFKSDSLVTDSGAELLHDEAVKVDFDKKMLVLKSKDILTYNKLVIATGAKPLIPGIPGVHLNGVMGFKTQQDLETIMAYVNNGLEKVVIVGAGAIGIELAQALKNKGLDVSLVDMASHVLPNIVGNEFARKAEEELIRNNIDLLLNTRVEKLIGKNSVDEVHLDTGEVIYLSDYAPCIGHQNTTIKGLVVFATGVVPELGFIANTPLKTGKQGIIVNEYMETNLKDIYAVGDCAQFNSYITGEVTGGKLATNAVPMARILADNLLGKKTIYKGFINGAATKVYNYFIGGTGLSVNEALSANFEVVKGYSQLTTQFPNMPGKKDLRMKLIADKKTLKIIGGQVLSGEPVTSLIDLISFAIQKQATVSDFIEISYASQPYQSFYPAGNIFVAAAEQIMEQMQ